MIKKIDGGATAAKGFKAASCMAGIKYEGREDMALIAADHPCRAAGTFTTNKVKAAPVIWDMDIVNAGNGAQAVVVNSGIANACTGAEGFEICQRTADAAAKALGTEPSLILTASTGVIGRQLPMDRIEAGIYAMVPKLTADAEGGAMAARAIMTTDTVSKEAAYEVAMSDGTVVTVGGCAKGSGMIHPNMCTMLAFITTDACISNEMLTKALKEVVPDTFNMVSVDGDTSTNDTCLVLAGGEAGNREIISMDEDYHSFREGLFAVCEDLAKMMAADGEGATCLFECHVEHAASKEDARILARAVVSSNLTKAAIGGHDANWGRILCALGYSGGEFDPDKTDLTLTSSAGTVRIMTDGVAEDYSEELATAILSESEIVCHVDVHGGEFSASAWGCDLTHEYVSINGDYRS